MAITTDKKSALQIFRPSVNILRDKDIRFNYTVTPNAQYVYTQLINDYKTGTRSFTITGAYGTGKSSFLLALQKTVNEEQPIFSGKPIDGPSSFAVLNVVGENTSLMEVLAEYVGLKSNKSVRAKDILASIDNYYAAVRKKNRGLMIVVDEFGKFLEYAAKNNPESELYFIQQLAEYVSDPSKEVMFITTLHQDFSGYARDLSKSQRSEWDKVRGRLKEITFNEPVEQLLFLAAERISVMGLGTKEKSFGKLFTTIGQSKAFPLRDYFNAGIAEKLLPFDILSGSILTLALQRYGQNERSLFSFIHSNDALS